MGANGYKLSRDGRQLVRLLYTLKWWRHQDAERRHGGSAYDDDQIDNGMAVCRGFIYDVLKDNSGVLREREAPVLKKHYYFGWSWRECSRRMGIKRESVIDVDNRAVMRIVDAGITDIDAAEEFFTREEALAPEWWYKQIRRLRELYE